MKSLLHLITVIVMASILNDFHQLAMRSSSSAHVNHGNMLDDNSVGVVLMTGVSATTPKRSQRSKLIFQIKIGTTDPKKRKSRKGKGKKLVRGDRRKLSSHRRHKHVGKRRDHRNHYHFLRKHYNQRLQALLKHGNHYHRPKPAMKDLFKKCCQRKFSRKDMTFNKRRHRIQSRRRPNKRRPFFKNSRRSKQFRRQSPRGKKTPFRKNQRKHPAKSNRHQSRRSKKVLRKYLSWKKGSKKNKRRPSKRINRRRKCSRAFCSV